MEKKRLFWWIIGGLLLVIVFSVGYWLLAKDKEEDSSKKKRRQDEISKEEMGEDFVIDFCKGHSFESDSFLGKQGYVGCEAKVIKAQIEDKKALFYMNITAENNQYGVVFDSQLVFIYYDIGGWLLEETGEPTNMSFYPTGEAVLSRVIEEEEKNGGQMVDSSISEDFLTTGYETINYRVRRFDEVYNTVYTYSERYHFDDKEGWVLVENNRGPEARELKTYTIGKGIYYYSHSDKGFWIISLSDEAKTIKVMSFLYDKKDYTIKKDTCKIIDLQLVYCGDGERLYKGNDWGAYYFSVPYEDMNETDIIVIGGRLSGLSKTPIMFVKKPGMSEQDVSFDYRGLFETDSNEGILDIIANPRTPEEAVEALIKLPSEVFMLEEEISKYRIEAEDSLTQVQGKRCYSVNIISDSGEVERTCYVALYGNEVFESLDDGSILQILYVDGSAAYAIVPNVVGMNEEEAREALSVAGLQTSTKFASKGDVPFGIVFSQSPEHSYVMGKGGSVVLMVSGVDTSLDTVNREQYIYCSYEGTVDKDGSRLRVAPGVKDKDGKIIETVQTVGGEPIVLNRGDKVRIYGERKDIDEDKWYHVTCIIDGETYQGYIYFGRVVRVGE